MNCIISLPIELIYNIMDFLSPFDILNFSKALMIKPYKRYYDEIQDEIYWFCSGNRSFIRIIQCIIDDKCMVDYDILMILDSIVYIIKKSSKYMDILGFSNYVFNIEVGDPYISKHVMPIIYNTDTQIINIRYPDTNILTEYLEKYLNFTSDFPNVYKIKKYNMKYLIK